MDAAFRVSAVASPHDLVARETDEVEEGSNAWAFHP